MPLKIFSQLHPPSSTWSHIVMCSVTREALIVDPVMGFAPQSAAIDHQFSKLQLDKINTLGATLHYILETHVHADHLSDAAWLKDQTGAQIIIGKDVTKVQQTFRSFYNDDTIETEGMSFDRLVSEGDQIILGEHLIRVIQTPGHTPACVTYLVDDLAFVGDTLMAPDIGTARCDFPSGSASTLFDSIQRILALPSETKLYLCHDYPSQREYKSWVTVQDECDNNIHVGNQADRADFINRRISRDKTLAPPALMIPALQVNVRGGRLPNIESDGAHHFKYPINKLNTHHE